MAGDVLNQALRCIEGYRQARRDDPGFMQLLSGNRVIHLISASRDLLERRIAAGVPRFDPFIAAGFDPSEDEISYALAELFDPDGGHRLGTMFLEALISAV